ncbi:hypothetical protein T02_12916 [Trichinella nativa]|uniref:Uncharacterized protein n=1 Tax=Trichinella nativa TaxID=6335 RepID=A0A0V1LA72_9BILA|nr:hypothetical protein T02_12916 [Trichinella nativa]
MSHLTTDVVEDKGIFALGLSIAGVNADSDFSIHCREMRLDPNVVIATDQITDDTFTKFVSQSLPSHVVMENKENFERNRFYYGKEFVIQRPESRDQTQIRDENLAGWSHLSSTDSRTTIQLPVARAMGHEKKRKVRMVNCLLVFPLTLWTSWNYKVRRYDRTDVNGFNARIANVRQLRFRLTPVHPDV